jgi:hypothetical protein
MLTNNKNVLEGEANGTQAIVEKVILKQGVQLQSVILSGDISVPAVGASDVAYILLRHSNKRINPATFKVMPKKHTFKASMLIPRSMQVTGAEREDFRMKATQIPIVSNNATTGHKLQGSGVESLFVHNWSYVTNWVYVMLSRVKTRAGLYCRKPISTDVNKYAVPESLTNMLASFRTRSAATYWTEEDYRDIFGV